MNDELERNLLAETCLFCFEYEISIGPFVKYFMTILRTNCQIWHIGEETMINDVH